MRKFAYRYVTIPIRIYYYPRLQIILHTQCHSRVVKLRTEDAMTLHVHRRELLLGIAAVAGSSGIIGSAVASPKVAIGSVPKLGPSMVSLGPEEPIRVSPFYRPEHGANLQPAFQAAIDRAAKLRRGKVVNDFGPIEAEMWCPIKYSGFSDVASDGIPLVIREPLHIDFAGASFALKGPGGGDRRQFIAGPDYPWFGGWLRVVGYPGFGRVTIENVKVDGGFAGSVTSNAGSNVSDKGFRVQDTDVKEVYLSEVELCNFAGEIYYIGGLGPEYQELVNCHFHGSPQSAFNPGGVGKLRAINLVAGRSYQAAEIVGGKGHFYQGGKFYDSCSSTILGGPSPSFRSGYPYNFSYWNEIGVPPWVEFDGTVFKHVGATYLGSWMRGSLRNVDSAIWLTPLVGHLHDIYLDVESWVDRGSGSESIGIFGPRDPKTQVALAPVDTFYEPPSNMKITVRCLRTPNAVSKGYAHACAVRLYGGLLDVSTIDIQASGEAKTMVEIFKNPDPVSIPQVTNIGFTALG